ncbi:MAG: hypothetical protein V9G12_02680 [Microthrixaceae bacterium]
MSATATPTAADDNPSTTTLRSSCDIDRTVSTGTAAGLPTVAPGERLTVSSRLVLDAGQAYQDVVGRPDGSTYFASVIELDPVGASGATITSRPSRSTSEASRRPSHPAPSPRPTATSSLDRRSVADVLPGDAATMLANVAGAGLPSIVVPADARCSP